MIKTVLFQGDSITDAGRSREDAMCASIGGFGNGYANKIASVLLAKNLGCGFACYNRGISGNRIVDLYARWKIDALNLKPDLISILIGVNDTWHEVEHQNGVELPRYEQFYRMLLEWTVRELPKTRLVLCEPFTLLSEAVDQAFYDDVAARAVIVKKLAKEFDATFVPLQQVLSEAAERAGDNRVILRDGVHPAIAGCQIIADQWLETVGL